MSADDDERSLLECPQELLDGLVEVGRATEASAVLLVTRAYRAGWADGYLARHHEEPTSAP